MKKYFILLVGLSLLIGPLAIADTSPSITAGISKEDLRQSLSIKEIPGQASNEVLIKAAKITSIGSNLLNISIFGYSYKIDISTNAKVLRQTWGVSSIDEFSVGDVVNVWGYLDSGDNYLIHAQTIRDLSIQKMHGVFKGTIDSINSTDKTFVLKTEERGNQTVIVSDSTKIIGGITTGSFPDLQVSLPVVVRGVWNKTLSKIQAEVIILGKSADVRPFFQKNSSIIKNLEEKLKSLKNR